MASEYSKTPLIKKLGIKPGHRACFLYAPAHFAELLGEIPEDVTVADEPSAPMDFVHYFAMEEGLLAVDFPALKAAIVSNGMIWISWPKRTSKLNTDLDFNSVQRIGLLNGLVDCKVCAVDDDWSAIKFMYRREDR